MQRIIFFDGDCNLCEGFISRLFKIDKKHEFTFASLNSVAAEKFLSKQDFRRDSVIYYDNGTIYFEARALLKILRQVGGIYGYFAVLVSFLPIRALNYFYKKVASNRYRIFGKRLSCRVPTAAEKPYFLD
jgi:predicted DCC family thiol-disulfide oxidoreductase YuxK